MATLNHNALSWETPKHALAKVASSGTECFIVATSALFARILATPAVQALAQRLEQGGFLSCSGVNGAAQTLLGALLPHLAPGRLVVFITDNLRSQELAQQDLVTWLATQETVSSAGEERPTPSNAPLFYPAWDVLPHQDRLPHADTISDRLEALVRLAAPTAGAASSPQYIVTTVIALLQRTFSRKSLAGRIRSLSRGDRADPLDLVEWLEAQGYEPEAQVTRKGEIALRGGILDLYPPTSPWPVRLEFFGDELESLRYFDPLTQNSREEIQSTVLPPAGELGLLKRVLGLRPADGIGAAEAMRTGLETLIDYLPRDAILLLCDPELLAGSAADYTLQIPPGDPFLASWRAIREQAAANGLSLMELSEEPIGWATETEAGPPTEPIDSRPAAKVASTPNAVAWTPRPAAESALSLRGLDAYRPVPNRAQEPQVAEAQRREFFAQLHRWLRQGYAVHVFCNNEGERQRFAEIWGEYGLGDLAGQVPSQPIGTAGRTTVPPGLENADPSPPPGAFSTHLGALSRGFLDEAAQLVVVTDAEIFGRYKVQRPRRLKSAHAQSARSALDIDFTELEEGDYVVHLQHGIGRYAGLQILPSGAGTKPTERAAPGLNAGQECLVIEYAPADPAQPPPRLYVPVTEAHLVSKYVGVGKGHPSLHTLGGARWSKAKAQAERAVRDVASDLLSIQAARESQAGHPFGPDSTWQREFESAFIFEETPDQMRAILETKADMERPKPMDRLICGDVGFGKTEVGIRAAFKAVIGGKQAAILVPTTVLAQQHYNTFRERMADYPVRIELLSRFRTRRAQDQVVRDLAAGSVDIVIGTHRLLQADIVFKDLGLVVIDEEQRFGVMHKEKFKMLRRLVDVLTLSATPIPRTLYLALAGARDMSTIQTPPQDRLPVETIVLEYDERVIRDAIHRELNRGGQVFFLHNRVTTIQTMAAKIQALLPQARILVGHGQMDSDELETVMTAFVNGEADILLSTTIIESGLDIPNANTIIIDRADRFGLSDLYQLRGRVGRYKHQAYAYLLLPRHARLLTDVRKRISAIKQYSTLGSGFKIALRDLEIRGAGNLLGAAQSGHITAVGFDLYCQLLKQSVAALKGEPIKARVEVDVRLDFLTFAPGGGPLTGTQVPSTALAAAAPPTLAGIPLDYISDARQRVEVYRKLALATQKAELAGLAKELRDRFGPLPPPLILLLELTDLKVLAAERGVSLIEARESKLMLTRHNDFVMVGGKFPRLSKKTPSARLSEIKKVLLAL